MCVYVRVCVCVRVRVCVRACVGLYVRACMCVCYLVKDLTQMYLLNDCRVIINSHTQVGVVNKKINYKLVKRLNNSGKKPITWRKNTFDQNA